MNYKTFAAAVAAIDKVTLDRDVLYVCIVGRNEDFAEDSVYGPAAMVKCNIDSRDYFRNLIKGGIFSNWLIKGGSVLRELSKVYTAHSACIACSC